MEARKRNGMRADGPREKRDKKTASRITPSQHRTE